MKLPFSKKTEDEPIIPVERSTANIKEWLEYVSKVCEQCNENAIEREIQERESQQGAFEYAMLSLDLSLPQADQDDPAWVSDAGAGAGVARSFDEPQAADNLTVYQRLWRRARDRLQYNEPSLVEVFDLIGKNGKDREESIWALTKKKRPIGWRPR